MRACAFRGICNYTDNGRLPKFCTLPNKVTMLGPLYLFNVVLDSLHQANNGLLSRASLAEFALAEFRIFART